MPRARLDHECVVFVDELSQVLRGFLENDLALFRRSLLRFAHHARIRVLTGPFDLSNRAAAEQIHPGKPGSALVGLGDLALDAVLAHAFGC